MNVRKFWSLVALGCICACFGYGCRNASSDSGVRILAKNIVFGTSTANAATLQGTAAVDTTMQVLAQNVIIDHANNALVSNNLQNALDDELAIKLSTYLPGTTWNITNKSADPTYSGSQGVITFSTGTLTLKSGKFAAIGLHPSSVASPCSTVLDPVSYEVLSEGVLYVTYTELDPGNTPWQRDGTATVIARSKDQMILVGTGGCGIQGIPRISILTRVP